MNTKGVICPRCSLRVDKKSFLDHLYQHKHSCRGDYFQADLFHELSSDQLLLPFFQSPAPEIEYEPLSQPSFFDLFPPETEESDLHSLDGGYIFDDTLAKWKPVDEVEISHQKIIGEPIIKFCRCGGMNESCYRCSGTGYIVFEFTG